MENDENIKYEYKYLCLIYKELMERTYIKNNNCETLNILLNKNIKAFETLKDYISIGASKRAYDKLCELPNFISKKIINDVKKK